MQVLWFMFSTEVGRLKSMGKRKTGLWLFCGRGVLSIS